MTTFKSLLEGYVKKDGPIVTYRDNGKRKTKGFGTIKCKRVQFSNVNYVKGLKHNLVSLSQLCDVDYGVHFNMHKRKVIDSNSVTVLSTSRYSNIYILDMFSTDNSLRRCFFCRS